VRVLLQEGRSDDAVEKIRECDRGWEVEVAEASEKDALETRFRSDWRSVEAFQELRKKRGMADRIAQKEKNNVSVVGLGATRCEIARAEIRIEPRRQFQFQEINLDRVKGNENGEIRFGWLVVGRRGACPKKIVNFGIGEDVLIR
jgi:hypothetical protein